MSPCIETSFVWMVTTAVVVFLTAKFMRQKKANNRSLHPVMRWAVINAFYRGATQMEAFYIRPSLVKMHKRENVKWQSELKREQARLVSETLESLKSNISEKCNGTT